MNTATIDGKRFVLIAESEYKRLTAGAKAVVDEALLPPLPAKDSKGNYPAVAYARAVLARKIITARKQANLSQAELARKAGIQPAVLNRIEKAKVTADVATV